MHVFAQKNVEGIGQLLHGDFALFDPALKWVRGKKRVLDVLGKQFSELEHVEYEIVHAFEEGASGIAEFRIVMDDLTLFEVDFMEFEREILQPFSKA